MIHLLWCTIRPEQFIKTHQVWMDRIEDKNDVITYVCVNWKEHRDIISEYIDTSKNYIITIKTDKIGVCYPSYELTSRLGIDMGICKDEDIVVFASDDFVPPTNWDKYLNEKFKTIGDKTLFVRDGYQLPDSSNMLHPAVTIPIMTYGCLIRLNRYIYHPSYSHMFSDCELYENLKDLDLLYDDRLNDTTVFEHLHYAAGKRNADQADQAYLSKWKDDEDIWNIRKNMPVEERIKSKSI